MTVIAVTDRNDFDDWNRPTDNIVVADSSNKQLTWVPRDLWVEGIPDRINECWRRGRHLLLMAALNELGFSIQQSICLSPLALEPLIANCKVSVPVSEKMEFYYPVRHGFTCQMGAKVIAFNPPEETIEGDRVHQWIGARKRVDGQDSPDMARVVRQQVLIRRLLETGFDFYRVDKACALFYWGEHWGDFKSVNASWSMKTYRDGMFKAEMRMGKYCLVPL